MSDRTAGFEQVEEAASRVKADVENLVKGFDVQMIGKRIEEFGSENPIGLALGALTVGVAVGVLMRSTRKVSPI